MRASRFTRPGVAWAALAVLLAAGALLGQAAPADRLDWQADRLDQAWRWWTCAFVHLSPRHLLANLAGCAVVGAFGWTARVPAGVTLAWLVAWPLGHLALAAVPGLARYAGLSGVLHAGVATVTVWLLAQPARRARSIGVAVLFGLAGKLVLEAPWRAAVQAVPGWDIAIVPIAHVAGTAAGALCGLVFLLTRRMFR